VLWSGQRLRGLGVSVSGGQVWVVSVWRPSVNRCSFNSVTFLVSTFCVHYFCHELLYAWLLWVVMGSCGLIYMGIVSWCYCRPYHLLMKSTFEDCVPELVFVSLNHLNGIHNRPAVISLYIINNYCNNNIVIIDVSVVLSSHLYKWYWTNMSHSVRRTINRWQSLVWRIKMHACCGVIRCISCWVHFRQLFARCSVVCSAEKLFL
jgi:hypothetical protein